MYKFVGAIKENGDSLFIITVYVYEEIFKTKDEKKI